MSIADRTAVSRSFVQASQSGFDRTFVCTNPETSTSLTIVDK